MKTFQLITSFIMITSYSFGQTNVYHPFPESDAIWLQSSWYNDGTGCVISDDHNLFISGDSVIGNYTYYKL